MGLFSKVKKVAKGAFKVAKKGSQAAGDFLGKISGGDLLSAGATIGGGLLANQQAKSLQGANEELQREFAQQGVRWKVADAKAAGVHPLYALGASPAQFTPSSIISPLGDSLSQAGQSIGRAINSTQTPDEKRLTALQLENLAAQTNKETAIAQYYESEAARNRQAANATKSIPMGIPLPSNPRLKVENLEDYYDAGLVEKEPIISKASDFPSSTAGEHAGLREYLNPLTGGKIMLPYSEEGPAEAMESTPFWMWPAIIKANKLRYGQDWESGLIKSYTDPIMDKVREGASRFQRWHHNN